MRKKSILVVDDDKEMLKIIRMFLMDDYQVAIVDNGRQAIEYIVKHTPDLILLDYMMPLFDGPHVLEIIRKREASRKLPVIFLTAVSEREQIMQCLKLNPQGYIVKPVSREDLLQRVREVLDKDEYGIFGI
ncbi:MAG: response regulator [Lachnospiraceae bacterium]|nr:response regulator [Lachnospiraceae bacterium]